jgi:hypothetical protein
MLVTVFGRRLLVERIGSGRPLAHVAAEMGISRATAGSGYDGGGWRVVGRVAGESNRQATTDGLQGCKPVIG